MYHHQNIEINVAKITILIFFFSILLTNYHFNV